jgi:hypothetical protein
MKEKLNISDCKAHFGISYEELRTLHEHVKKLSADKSTPNELFCQLINAEFGIAAALKLFK